MKPYFEHEIVTKEKKCHYPEKQQQLSHLKVYIEYSSSRGDESGPSVSAQEIIVELSFNPWNKEGKWNPNLGSTHGKSNLKCRDGMYRVARLVTNPKEIGKKWVVFMLERGSLKGKASFLQFPLVPFSPDHICQMSISVSFPSRTNLSFLATGYLQLQSVPNSIGF